MPPLFQQERFLSLDDCLAARRAMDVGESPDMSVSYIGYARKPSALEP